MTGDQTEMPLGIHGTTGIVKYLSFLSIVTPYISVRRTPFSQYEEGFSKPFSNSWGGPCS